MDPAITRISFSSFSGLEFHALPANISPGYRFLGWYLSEGHCYEAAATGNCTVTLTTYYRHDEAKAVKTLGSHRCAGCQHLHHHTRWKQAG